MALCLSGNNRQIKNRPQEVRDAFNARTGQLCISSVTLMELIYGAEKYTAPERNLREIEGFFAARLEVLPYEQAVANHTGQIRAE